MSTLPRRIFTWSNILEDHYEVIGMENGFKILRRREDKHTD